VCVDEAWQKRYLVLRDSWTDDGDTSLELYACSNADSSKCHAVSLRNVMLVDVYRDSKSFPHAFIVFRSETSLQIKLPALCLPFCLWLFFFRMSLFFSGFYTAQCT